MHAAVRQKGHGAAYFDYTGFSGWIQPIKRAGQESERKSSGAKHHKMQWSSIEYFA